MWHSIAPTLPVGVAWIGPMQRANVDSVAMMTRTVQTSLARNAGLTSKQNGRAIYVTITAPNPLIAEVYKYFQFQTIVCDCIQTAQVLMPLAGVAQARKCR